MRAWELYENDLRALGIYEPAEDRLGQREVTDICKGRLTLRKLNRLKHIRNARRRDASPKSAAAENQATTEAVDPETGEVIIP